MTKNLFIFTFILSVLLGGCSSNTSEENILLTVNSEAIYEKELDQISSAYTEKGLTETEIIEGMVLELITLQQADVLPISIDQKDVDSRFQEFMDLKESVFYKKMIEQYGTEQNYKDALYYKLVYDEFSAKIKSSFSDYFSINETLLQKRSQDYISQYTNDDFEKNNIDKELFYDEVIHRYQDSLLSSLEDLYFKVWQYQTACSSDLSSTNYDVDTLFQKSSNYSITSTTFTFHNNTYDLKEISLQDMQERFGNYFYLSNSLLNRCGSISARAIHIPEKDVQGLYVTLGEDSQMTVQLVISPSLSAYHHSQEGQIIRAHEGHLNKITLVQSELGIYYSIIGDMDYQELEKFLNDNMPYHKI